MPALWGGALMTHILLSTRLLEGLNAPLLLSRWHYERSTFQNLPDCVFIKAQAF
jgi:hypothetical protein